MRLAGGLYPERVAAVAHLPWSLDTGPLTRLRRPLAAISAALLVIDLIGLGLHLADAANAPFASETANRAETRVGGPEAVVKGDDIAPRAGNSTSTRRVAQPLGCLAAGSGCYVAPPPTSTGKTPSPQGPSAGPAPVTPIAQVGAAVPALGTQVSLGLGDDGCTGVALLNLLALGDCAAPAGDGAVVLPLGGSLVGE